LKRLEQVEKRRPEKSAKRTLDAALARVGFELNGTTAYFSEVVKSAAVPILIAGAAVALAVFFGDHRWPFGSLR
jgi:hypothetical protein